MPRNEWDRVVVVISAMSGITNLLLDSARLAAQGRIDSLPDTWKSTLREKHFLRDESLIKDKNFATKRSGRSTR